MDHGVERAAITTRQPAHWPTSWRASTTPACVTVRPSDNRSCGPTRSSNARHSPLPLEEIPVNTTCPPCRPPVRGMRAPRAAPWTSLPLSLPLPFFACAETDRPSWQTGSHPHGLTPTTPPAASCVPLVTIGAPWADSMSARTAQSPLTMPDIRLHALPYCHKKSIRSLAFRGSPYTKG